ncbi:MAG: benzoate-CoA ligase family protein [Pikeienuella sp.]
MTSNANAAKWFVDRHRDGKFAQKAAFIEAGENGRTLTYGDLAEQTDCMPDLLARHDIRREDRALMLVLDEIEFPIIFWGALKAGVVPTPVNTLLATEIYDAILRDSRATALFVSAPLFEVVEPLLANAPYLRKVFVIGGKAREGAFDFATELAASAPKAMVDASADEIAFWLYSSGSTGAPKGVRHVHSALRATADTYGAQVLKIREDDVIHSAAKAFFAYGLGNAMTFPMSVGATTILNADRPTPDGVADILATHRPTVFCGVPTLYAALGMHLEANGAPDCPLRISISAGEALPADVGARWKRLMGVDILDGVGSTEMLHIFLSNAEGNLEYGTSGVAVPGYDVRLVDDAGKDVAQGEIGELLVRGASAADGYWNQRTKSRATFAGEWTHTGDKYEQRADGRFVYCGRTDDMFKVSGIWLSPFEVEQALTSHEAVLESAVVAHRDEQGLEKPMAFIVLAPGATAPDTTELKEYIKDRIGKWKYPRWIEIVPELPKTATGKIQRFKLRG